MSKEKTESNPLEFLLVIFIALGIVGYKFVQEKGINTIITQGINVLSFGIGACLMILLIVFSIRDFVEQKKSIFSNNYIKILTIIISGIFMIIPLLTIDYMNIDKLFTITNICILILSMIIILISHHIINDYLAKKGLFKEISETYERQKYTCAYDVKLAITEIETIQQQDTRLEKLYHKKFVKIISDLEFLRNNFMQEEHKEAVRLVAEYNMQIRNKSIERDIINKLVAYFKERKTTETIPEWATSIHTETIKRAISEYEKYLAEEYHKIRMLEQEKDRWENIVEFMLEHKGLPNNYTTLSEVERESYIKAYRLMKEHKLEKTSEENPQVLEEDEELVQKYFYQANELTAEQRHRFIHNYGYRLKPFIFIETGQRGNNLIIKNDTRKESDYHFCIKHLLANVHKKKSYIEYDIEQLRTDIMINVNGQLYAFEIETGNNKALQIERKVIWLNKHFNEWYIVCSRDNKKRYKKYVSKKKGQILTVTQAYNKILEINHLPGRAH